MTEKFFIQNREFETHRVNFEGQVKMWKIREAFDNLLNIINEQTEIAPAKEWEKTREHLEIACFYAIKQVSLLEKNQEKLN
jgi:hypothetical protein